MLSRVDPATPPLAAIFGLKGPALTKSQIKFFQDANPLGFILFGINDNIDTPAQLLALTDSLRDCMGRDIPILIDQEGGRVARLKPPHWPTWPTAKSLGDLAQRDKAKGLAETVNVNRSIAQALKAVGITVNCAPVLDVAYPQTHAVIGDRAFSDDPALVGELGVAACKAYLDEGVIPVVKHIPGHGRATADSHKELPVVRASMKIISDTDLVPYYALLKEQFAKAVWGMVAHVIYIVPDPVHPASCSPTMIGMLRKNVGFDGFLLSDDIVMGALAKVGTMADRAVASLNAGCDAVLHCNGDMKQMKQVAKAAPVMTADAVRRFNASIV